MFASRTAYWMRRLKRPPLWPMLSGTAGAVSLIGLALFIGLSSAWLMIDEGTALTTRFAGPWVNWQMAGNGAADPYTQAHVARSGRLPMISSNALYFLAAKDSDGESLAKACEYSIEGKPLESDWWSLAAYHPDGSLIANKANRHAFSSTSILRRKDGSYAVLASKNARPGNWLPIEGQGEFVLLMRIFGPRVSSDTNRNNVIEANLPVIEKVRCAS